jgi:hypothetical protein
MSARAAAASSWYGAVARSVDVMVIGFPSGR